MWKLVEDIFLTSIDIEISPIFSKVNCIICFSESFNEVFSFINIMCIPLGSKETVELAKNYKKETVELAKNYKKETVELAKNYKKEHTNNILEKKNNLEAEFIAIVKKNIIDQRYLTEMQKEEKIR